MIELNMSLFIRQFYIAPEEMQMMTILYHRHTMDCRDSWRCVPLPRTVFRCQDSIRQKAGIDPLWRRSSGSSARTVGYNLDDIDQSSTRFHTYKQMKHKQFYSRARPLLNRTISGSKVLTRAFCGCTTITICQSYLQKLTESHHAR